MSNPMSGIRLGFTPFETSGRPLDPAYLHFKLHQTSEKVEDIPIMAEIKDLKAWKALENVKTGAEVKTDKGWIISARVPSDQFEMIAQLPFVISLKMARKIHPLEKLC